MCVANDGYVFMNAGNAVCAAGQLHNTIPTAAPNPFGTHMIVSCNDPAHTGTNTKGDMRHGAVRRRQATVDANPSRSISVAIASAAPPGAAGRTRDEPFALRGRVHTDKRFVFEMCHVIGLPEKVQRDANMILDFINAHESRTFKRRAQKRQALVVAVVCIACERNDTDHHGERFRQMCTIVLGQEASGRAFTVFGRQVRSMRICVCRELADTTPSVAPDSYALRIVNHAWGRLGRCGFVEHEIARVTRVISAIVAAIANSDTKFGDSLVPCAVYMLYGDDEKTVAACDEYVYRLSTIARHVASIQPLIDLSAEVARAAAVSTVARVTQLDRVLAS